MKFFYFLIGSCLFFSNVYASEIFVCEKLRGWESADGKLKEAEIFYSECQFILSGTKAIIECDGKDIGYDAVVVRNNESRADIIAVPTLTTEIYTIDKKNNELLYVKNGIIEKGYSMMMKSKCRRK